MIMVNILHRGDSVLRGLRLLNKFYINVVTDIVHLHTGVPTLILGYDLAKETIGDVKPDQRKINQFYWWCKPDDEDYIQRFVERCVTKSLDHVDHGIDPVFDGFDPDQFFESLSSFPLVHNGKHELYVVEDLGDKIVVHSLKHDALRYVGYDPDRIFEQLIVAWDGAVLVLSTDEFKLNLDHQCPVFMFNLIEADHGQKMSINGLVGSFSPRYMSKPELLTYLMKKIAHLRVHFPLFVDALPRVDDMA